MKAHLQGPLGGFGDDGVILDAQGSSVQILETLAEYPFVFEMVLFTQTDEVDAHGCTVFARQPAQ